MKEVIIEPHSDDAWLGLGGYMLLNPDTEFLIITIAESEKNRNKTFLLRKFGKIKNICYGLKNLERWDFEEKSDIKNVFEQKNNIKLEDLDKWIKRDCEGYDKVYLPQGYRDPMHNLLARLKADGYYREVPYYWNRSEWKGVDYQYNNYIDTGKNIELGKTFEYKWKIFDVIYQDQLGMFQWFRPYYKNIKDEEIYYAKETDI